MSKHDFIPGVTDQGPPRAAKGGFPYPGHKTLGQQREEQEQEIAVRRARERQWYLRNRKSWRTAEIKAVMG